MSYYFGEALDSAFDMIACINLDQRVDRWQYVQKQFQMVGLADKVKRISAVDFRSNPEMHVYEQIVSKNFSLLARYGCMMSHRKAISLALEEGCKNLLVFEDDVRFILPNLTGIQQTIQALNEHPWQIFYLGATYLFELEILNNYLVRVPYGAYATHAIAYSLEACKKLVEILPDSIEEILESRFLKDNNAIDVLLKKGPFTKDQFYGANPIMVVQGMQESDIAVELKSDIALKQVELFEKELQRAKLRQPHY